VQHSRRLLLGRWAVRNRGHKRQGKITHVASTTFYRFNGLLAMPATPLPKKILARQHEITADFTRLVHAHVEDLGAGRATEALEIRDFASQLCLHPTHLSNTVKLVTGEAACAIYERKLVAEAKALLLDPRRTIADVAAQLTYDPSNFTKFFRHFVGLTPKQFREQNGTGQLAKVEKTQLATV